MNAKETLNKFANILDKKLEEFWYKKIKTNFGFSEKQKKLIKKILAHSCEHNLRPAKRIRGSLVYFASKLYKNVPEKVSLQAAMAIELVHTALLMHDDVMDQDTLRRGKPTTHIFFQNNDIHYGESMAYTTGVAILCLGFELMTQCDWYTDLVLKSTRQILSSIEKTAYGQAYDITLSKMQKWTEKDIIALHKSKTAIYTFENPLFVGAILSGITNKKIFDTLHSYAMCTGVAFQLQDDILGLYGNPKKTGKSDYSDLLQGKCTLLVNYVRKKGTQKQKEAIKKVWGKKHAEKEDIESAKKAIIESGSLEHSRSISRKYAKKAIEISEKLYNFCLNKKSVDYFKNIVEYMIERQI